MTSHSLDGACSWCRCIVLVVGNIHWTRRIIWLEVCGRRNLSFHFQYNWFWEQDKFVSFFVTTSTHDLQRACDIAFWNREGSQSGFLKNRTFDIGSAGINLLTRKWLTCLTCASAIWEPYSQTKQGLVSFPLRFQQTFPNKHGPIFLLKNHLLDGRNSNITTLASLLFITTFQISLANRFVSISNTQGGLRRTLWFHSWTKKRLTSPNFVLAITATGRLQLVF